MKHAISIITVLFFSLASFGQIRSDPKLIVQKDDPYFSVLSEHQAQIRQSYEKGKLIIPTFGNWFRVESVSASQLFRKLVFYSISWSESLNPDANPDARKKAWGGLAMGIEETVGIRLDTGKIEWKSSCSGNYDEYGQLLVKSKVAVQSIADAKIVWDAFCGIHHRHWQEHPINRISDTEWHLGISNYDQVISATDKFNIVVTRTHYMRVMVNSESNQVLSWESKVDTSNERKISK